TFLRREARDDADERMAVERLQGELPEQVSAANGFAGKILRRIVRRNEFVTRRAPLGIINAVEDAVKMSTARAQNAFQPKAIFRRLDLLRVATADGSDRVREDDPTLEEVHLAVELHAVHGEELPRQIEQRQHIRLKESLIALVVDREDDTRLAEGRIG